MQETVTQRRSMGDEGLAVKPRKGGDDDPALEKFRSIAVPAIAVRRLGRVLFLMIGRKGSVDGRKHGTESAAYAA